MKERDYFPLSLDQMTVILWSECAPASMLNLAVRIDIESDLDEGLFLLALKKTVELLPYSRCRLHDLDDKTTVQYISEVAEQNWPSWIDATGWAEKKLSKQLFQWASTSFPNNQRDVQLFHAELLKVADGKHCLFFCGHHVVMDIYAVVFFINYLDKVYDALLNSTLLPREGGSPKKITLERKSYLNSQKYQKDFEWLKSEYATEPLFTSINGVGGKEYIKNKRFGHDRSILQMAAKEKIFKLDQDLENAVNQFCLNQNITPNIVYAFAIRCYLSAICNVEDVSIDLLYSLRSTLEEKSSGLTRAGTFNFRINLSNKLSFSEALKQTNFKNYDYLKHAQYPDVNQQVKDLFHCPRDCNYFSICYSYVPFVNFESIHLKAKATKIDSGIALCPVYVLIMHTAQNEGLSVIYQYSKKYVKPENIDKCQAFILKFLDEGLKNPEKSVQDLIVDCL